MKLIARIYDCPNKNIRPRALLKYECANLNTHTAYKNKNSHNMIIVYFSNELGKDAVISTNL